jgi:hypothetical protein
MTFPATALERLSARVLEGDVVFFIGSGASIDSEKNSAARLMGRLLVRLLAFAEVLDGDHPGTGRALRDDLVHTFGLDGTTAEEIAGSEQNISGLAKSYYEANEWFCSAYGTLLAQAARRRERPVSRRMQTREQELLACLKSADAVALDPLDSALLQLAAKDDTLSHRAAGKALFLDTMGFGNLSVMGGKPGKKVPFREVESSYEGRLFPRHHILARFAREGLCPAILTTNFDLLVEGAYRLAGFRDQLRDDSFPATMIPDFQTIASPEDFFTEGKAYREAIVVKMHGCAQRYRDVRSSPEALREYLRSMVFTYREIQNWREDSWAADYLRTLLRTRVVVFCGYSLQDPVIHDTFRTVYEEMARIRSARPTREPETAPAFFFGKARQFHGMAVLQAATAAVGAKPAKPGTHPNFLPFHFRHAPEFPNFDELLRWLFHLTFRARQMECLKSDLRRITTLLLGGPRPESELVAVQESFAALVEGKKGEEEKGEKEMAQAWTTSAGSRREHAEICAWTDLFHVGLLREFSCGDVVRRRQGAGLDLGMMRRAAWYYPAMQDASWTCWGAVVEMALRAMAKRAQLDITVSDCRQPTILIRQAGRGTPHAITIHFGGFERVGLQARLLGHPWRRVFWELGPDDAPWRRAVESTCARPRNAQAVPLRPPVRRKAARQILRAPDAMVIWRWATGTVTKPDVASVKQTLGFP